MSYDSEASHERASLLAESAFVKEARSLTDRQRQVLGVSALQIHAADIIYKLCIILIDDRDPRPLLDRMDDVERLLELAEGHGFTDAIASWGDDGPELPAWLRRASRPDFQRFVLRLLGARRFDRLKAALRTDGAVVAVAVRRGLRYLLPLAAATDRCIRALSPDQLAAISGVEALVNSSLLEMAVKLDSELDRFLDTNPALDSGVARADELVTLPGGMGEIAKSMAERVSSDTALLIEELSATLARKVKGARDALEYSSDAVSQAANSVIELIDRLLRDAFDPDFVLAWIRTWYPDRAELVHERSDGSFVPTKRGQALCFAFAGGEVRDKDMIQELTAAALVSLRTRLQAMKHADQGTQMEREALVEMIVAVESSLLLICKFAWLAASEPTLTNLRLRLAPSLGTRAVA